MAAKMALPTAGATATIGVSPAPAEGTSLRSMSTVSSSRRVGEAGHAVIGEARVQDLAVVELNRLEQGPAEAHYRGALRSGSSGGRG